MEVTSSTQKTGTIFQNRDSADQSKGGASFSAALNQAASPAQSTTPETSETTTDDQSSATKTWSPPWLDGVSDATADELLFSVDEYNTRKTEGRVNEGKPNLREFMDKADVDARTASGLLYGTLGAAPDMRDWAAIMASDDPAKAARQATSAQINSTDHADYINSALKSAGYKPVADNRIIAKAGNFAVVKDGTQNGEPQLSLRIIDVNNQITQSVSWSAPDILSTAEEYGLDLEPLNDLADQLDEKGIAYMPNKVYAGSDQGVDLRDIASGGMGSAYDWTEDSMVSAKGDTGLAQLRFNQLLASRLGLKSE